MFDDAIQNKIDELLIFDVKNSTEPVNIIPRHGTPSRSVEEVKTTKNYSLKLPRDFDGDLSDYILNQVRPDLPAFKNSRVTENIRDSFTRVYEDIRNRGKKVSLSDIKGTIDSNGKISVETINDGTGKLDLSFIEKKTNVVLPNTASTKSYDVPRPPPETQPGVFGGTMQYKYKKGKDEFLPEFTSPTNTSAGRANYAKSGFWGKVARLGGARQASHSARKMGAGVFGSAVAYEIGAGAVGTLLAGVAGAKANIVGRIAGAVTKYAPGVGRGLKTIGPRIEPLAVRLDGVVDGKYDKKEMFTRRADEIRNAGPGLNDALFMAVEPMMGNHPEFAKAVMDSAITAFNGLISFLPRDPGTAFSRLKSLWKPSDLQVAQFEKAYKVFHDPTSTIEEILMSGNADVTTVEALKTMYPSLYNELQYKMMDRLSTPGFNESLSYSDQARLSILLGIPIHSSFTPRSIAQTQSMYISALQNRQSIPPSDGSGKGGRPTKSEPPTAGQSLLQ
jgi:hypothetical protein